MAPPAALRRRLEARATSAPGQGAAGGRDVARRWRAAAALCCGAAALAAVAWAALQALRSPGNLERPDRAPAVVAALAAADAAVRKDYSASRALKHLELARRLAPQDAGVLQFYASVLVSLGRLEEAYVQFKAIFESAAPEASDPHFLQQFVVTLHRLGRRGELDEVWPRMAAVPGIKWRSPLQCPDQVEEQLLDGAAPFPDVAASKVVQRILEKAPKIQQEFSEFRKRADWSSEAYFRPNQDNDLVRGNEPQRWTEMLLFNKGLWDYQNCALLPTACKALQGLVEVEGIFRDKRCGQVSLLKLEEGTQLVPHFGSVNWRFTAQLGLLVPDNVWIHVGDESRTFVQGELLVLDDSFLHSVEHNGTGPRVTFYVNFFHPRASLATYDEWLARKR